MLEIEDVFDVCTTETINALIIITNYKDIGLLTPIIDQQFNQHILRSAGILVFIHQNILILFLVIGQQVWVFFKCPDHPIDHVVKIITVTHTHHLLKAIVFVDGGPQFFHFFPLLCYFIFI